jgi:hypothetical protein
MLDNTVVRETIARLRAEGWHYERDLLSAVQTFQVGDVMTVLAVLLAAGVIRSQGNDDRKRYKWI